MMEALHASKQPDTRADEEEVGTDSVSLPAALPAVPQAKVADEEGVAESAPAPTEPVPRKGTGAASANARSLPKKKFKSTSEVERQLQSFEVKNQEFRTHHRGNAQDSDQVPSNHAGLQGDCV